MKLELNLTNFYSRFPDLSLVLMICFCFAIEPDGHAAEDPGPRTLSLAKAIAKALEYHPALATYDADLRAAEARIISALERPNPDLDTEIEDVLGSGEYEGFRSAVYNVGVSQLLELGGKRQIRGDIAQANVEAERLGYEAARR